MYCARGLTSPSLTPRLPLTPLISAADPSTVLPDMGPTVVAPGSHYLSLPGDGDGSADAPDPAIPHHLEDFPGFAEATDSVRTPALEAALQELGGHLRSEPLTVRAGTFVLINYALYHRREGRGLQQARPR